MESISISSPATIVETLVDRIVAHTFRWDLRRPASVDPQHWHQVMLHACSHAWIGGLQSFSIGNDTASLCVHGPCRWRDAQGGPAELMQALRRVDAALKRCPKAPGPC